MEGGELVLPEDNDRPVIWTKWLANEPRNFVNWKWLMRCKTWSLTILTHSIKTKSVFYRTKFWRAYLALLDLIQENRSTAHTWAVKNSVLCSERLTDVTTHLLQRCTLSVLSDIHLEGCQMPVTSDRDKMCSLFPVILLSVDPITSTTCIQHHDSIYYL